MAKRVQLIRHAVTEANQFKGLSGEITVDLTGRTLRVHDGVQTGGYALARADLSNAANATITQAGKMTAAQVVALNAALQPASIGVTVQAYDDSLQSLAALATAADKAMYTTATDVYAETPLTAYGRSLIDDADAATARATLGLGTAAVKSDTYFEVAFSKNSAFNQDFGTSGMTVAYGNHTHAGVYEPVFSKNTAFNKNLGTSGGTVSEGNHLHAGVYEPAFSKNSAFNKNYDGSGVASTIPHTDHDHSSVSEGKIEEPGLGTGVKAKLVTNGNSHDHVGGDGAQLSGDALFDLTVDTNKLANGAINQQKLETAAETHSTVSTTGEEFLTIGGAYSFQSLQAINTATGNNAMLTTLTISSIEVISRALGNIDGANNYVRRITLAVNNATYIASNRSRYVQASPPYDIGNGDIPLFMYALINSSGEIESISTAPDPVWAYNGRNSINPSLRYRKKGKQNYFYMKKQRPDRELDFAAWRESFENPKIITEVETEITHAVKNQDMDQVPHPFIGNDLTGKTVVLIDPVGNLCDCLFEMHEEGEDVHDIIRNYLDVKNIPISGAVTPEGLMTVKANWKRNTL